MSGVHYQILVFTILYPIGPQLNYIFIADVLDYLNKSKTNGNYIVTAHDIVDGSYYYN